MNHVFSVTCCRSGQSLRASGQQPLLSAICRTRRNWFGTRNAEPLEGACKSSIRREWSSTWEYKHSSIQDSKAATNRTKIFTIKAREAPRSFFHSSATFSKAKKSAKQPPRRPPQRQVTPGSSQILPSKNKPSSSTQNLPHKTRDKRNLPPYLPPQDLNPSGKPIYSGSQEWEDCVKNVSLDPPSKDEAEKIFGEVLPVKEALEILKVLQYQRLSGTLDHAIAAPQVTANLVANALQFLREKYPFDEDAAIMARIEREYDAEESQVADVDGKPAYVPQQDAEKTGVYGTPSFDSIVAERRAKLEQKEAERAKEAAEKGEEAGPLAVRQTFREKALAVRQQESAEWVRKYKEKALLSEGPPPDVPVRRRLLPSAMFTLITILCCLTFATFYIPPPRAARLFPDTPPAASTVLALIAVNAVVFVAWRVPPMWRFMNTHFILVAGAPTVSSLLGCMFSHHRFSHFFFNMTALWFVGTWLHDDIGRANFLATYVGGGVLASFIALSAFVLCGQLNISTLGASGAVYSIIAARCIFHAGEKFKFAFLPEDSEVGVPALWLLGAIFALELLSLKRAPFAVDQAVDRTSHFSALMVGSAIGILLRLKLRFQESQRRENNDSKGRYNVAVSKPVAPVPIK